MWKRRKKQERDDVTKVIKCEWTVKERERGRNVIKGGK